MGSLSLLQGSKNVSLTLATQKAIERKLEMRVDALEEAVIHIGTELQALISPALAGGFVCVCVCVCVCLPRALS